jgi:glucoamylase
VLSPRSVRGVRRPRHRRCRALGGRRRAERGRPRRAPGAKAFWTPANKQGFGTAMTRQSKVWHTLQAGELTEVYYPDLSTPALRDLQLIVTDGKTFTDRETDATDQRVELVDEHSLT